MKLNQITLNLPTYKKTSMDNSLQFHSTKGMSREHWLAYRKTGVGASEVGVIMGLSPYKSSIELFYEKVGEEIGNNIENIFMFTGKELEEFVADKWQYWEGSEQSLIENFRAGRVIRRCRRVNAYVRNPKYPWLFVSLDRVINKTKTYKEGALEIKTIGGWEVKKWEGGIPPSHVIQVITQILICSFDFGELATLTDGRRFDVTPFERNKEISQAIIHDTKDFWDRVVKAREILTQRFQAKRKFNYRAVDDLTSQLAEIEPPADGSDAYRDFIALKYGKSTAGEISGGIIQLQDAIAHKKLTTDIDLLKTERQLFENKLKNFMGHFDRLDFGAPGYITWKSDVNNTRRFINNVTE